MGENYDFIVIEDKCIIQATFHIIEEICLYEIMLNSQIPFKTRHHSATYQMLTQQLKLDQNNKSVLDVVCGKGVLAIMACLRKAKSITTIYINKWCVENSIKNIQLYRERLDALSLPKFDVILVNVNKNHLHQNIKIETLASRLTSEGVLLMSGFYDKHVVLIRKAIERHYLTFLRNSIRNSWVLTLFKLNY